MKFTVTSISWSSPEVLEVVANTSLHTAVFHSDRFLRAVALELHRPNDLGQVI